MPEDIDIQKLKKEYPDFFENNPSGLIEFILAEKTSEKIAEICVRNGIKEGDKIEDVAYRITWALLGKLPKENLAFALEKGAKLSPETAKKIADEANRSIVFKVPASNLRSPVPPQEKIAEEPKKPKREDTYRESIE